MFYILVAVFIVSMIPQLQRLGLLYNLIGIFHITCWGISFWTPALDNWLDAEKFLKEK